MTKKVTVIVEGREYVVEVGDLNESPIRATVNQRTYNVQVPETTTEKSSKPALPPTPAPAPKPAVSSSPAPAASSTSSNSITAPMPGDIVAVEVRPGASVSVGDVICVLEAMKMKNMIRTPRAGVIATVDVSPGQPVEFGALLVTFE